MLHQVDGSERISGGHVWQRLLDSLNGNHGLAHVVPTGRLGNPKGLPDDILKIPVLADMRAQAAAKEKPRAVDSFNQGELVRAGLVGSCERTKRIIASHSHRSAPHWPTSIRGQKSPDRSRG